MDVKTIEKIREFYKPEYNEKGFTIEAKGKRVSLSLSSDKPIFFSFGDPAKSEQEALEKGHIKTTPRELFVHLFPDEWEKIKHEYEDERTEKYLNVCKRNIGLLKIEHGYREEQLLNYETINVFLNTSPIKIGKTKNDEWVAQFSQRVDIDDYDITRIYFDRKPDVTAIRTAALIDKIYFYFQLNGYDKVNFTCWECGVQQHWLDITGNLSEKWDKFMDKYCGC